ncbi:MAG: beta strand repeat-containing protein [Gammaproteobacteria bacterium]
MIKKTILSHALIIFPLIAGLTFAVPALCIAAPVAVDDNAVTALDTPVAVDVLVNDTGGPVANTLQIVRPFRRGIFANRDGKAHFVPRVGSCSDEMFQYTVRDAAGTLSNPATVTVSLDCPPRVDSIVPADEAIGVALDSNVVATFNEPVSASAGAFSVECPSGIAIAFTSTPALPATNTSSFTLDPDSDLPENTTCAVTVQHSGIIDEDASPDPMAADFTASFATTDAPPKLIATQVEVAGTLSNTPAANVDADTGIVINFSEAVSADADAFSVNCSASGNVTARFGIGGLPGATATLTNSGAGLVPGESCTLTVKATSIHDVDGIDPPDTMSADITAGFTIDAVLRITQVNVDTETAADQNAAAGSLIDVNPNSPIDTLFSEPADATNGWLSIVCDGIDVGYSPGGFTARTSVTSNPALEPGESCTLTYASAGLTDADLSDPPNNLDGDGNGLEGGNKLVTFGVRPNAVTDSYSAIHTNVGINVPAGNGVLANDDLGDASPAPVVGWGVDAASAQNNTLGAGAEGATAQGGLATVNADGSFDYDPPAAFIGTDTFYYHISNANGDHVGQVNLSVSGTRVWFINDTSPGSANRGTLQNPFTSLGTFNASGNTQTGDYVHIEHNSAAYGGGLILKNDMTVIGEGATGTLSGFVASLGSISSFSPALPMLNGTGPTLSNSSGHGVTLSATNNTLHGFNVGNTSGTGVFGSGAGTLTVRDCAITGTGVGLNVSGKTLDAAFSEISSSNNSGILLNNVTGDFDVSTGIITAGANAAVSIVGGAGNVDLGATLEKVSANGALHGIVLTNTTGTSGGFAVTGDGSLTRNDSGGIIQNTTNHAVVLNNAHHVSLRSLRIDTLNNAGTHGIFSTGGSDFTFSAMTIQNINGGLLTNQTIACLTPPTDIRGSAWRGTDLGGVNRIDHGSLFTAFDPDADAAVDVRNCNSNMTSLTINDSDFTNQDSSNGKSVVFIESSGSVNMGTITVENGSLFSGLHGIALQTATNGSSTMTTYIQGNIFRDANPGGLGGNNGVAFTASGSSNHSVTIAGNQFDDVQLAAGNAGSLAVTFFDTSSGTAVIDGNRFEDLDSDGDVVKDAQAIRVVSEQTGGGAVNATISNNVLNDIGRQAVFVSTRNQAPDVDVQINNNTIGNLAPVGFTNRDAIAVSAEDDSNLDLLVSGNNVTAYVSSQEVINLLTDRVSAGNTPVLNATINNNNTFTNNYAGGADNVVIETLDTGETLCVNMSGNILTGVNTIDLVNTGATFSATQANAAALASANNAATVNVSGTVNFGQPACPLPTF